MQVPQPTSLVLLAIHDEFENRVARNLALTSLSDLRGVLRESLTERDLGLYIATITTVHAVAAEPDFWKLAARIRQRLQEVLSSGDANLVHGMYREDSLVPPGKNAALLVQAAVSLAPASSILTNIGRLDDAALDNGVAIRSLAFLVSPPPQHPICATVTTYADCMHLNVLYDQTKR